MNDFRNRSVNTSNNVSDIREIDLNKTQIGQSGNSDVDVNVNVIVETNAIAYAYLCSMLATNKMSHEEFDVALKKLDELTKRDRKKEEKRNREIQNVQDIDYLREKRRKQGFW